MAEEAVGEAELASSLVRVPAAVLREELVVASGLGSRRPVVRKASAPEDVVDALHDGLEDVLHGTEQISEGVEELCVGGPGGHDQDDEEEAGEADEGQLHAVAVYRILSFAEDKTQRRRPNVCSYDVLAPPSTLGATPPSPVPTSSTTTHTSPFSSSHCTPCFSNVNVSAPRPYYNKATRAIGGTGNGAIIELGNRVRSKLSSVISQGTEIYL